MKVFKVLCALLWLGWLAPISDAQENVTTPAATPLRAGTSDSGDMKNRLRFRVERALGENGAALGVPNGYHWIFLVQVARYKDSNIRFTDERRGLQAFLDELVASRRAWLPETVGDTVSIIPYHFNILGAANERQKPLRDFLTDTTSLKQKVPGQPQDDVYGDGQTYRDGHDWRNAMKQTLNWMKKEDVPIQNAIIVVLDWNDLAQAPQQTTTGASQAGVSKYLTLPQNAARWKAFNTAMQSNGIAPKNLETVQVGNLEYDMAVFTAKDFRPIGPVATLTPVATATPEEPVSGDGSAGFLLLIPLLAVGAFIASRGFATHGLKINDKNFAMRAFGPTATLDILGAKGKPKSGVLSYVLPESAAPNAAGTTLATIKVNLMGKVLVSKGAYQVKANRGFKSVPNGGAEMTAQSGVFELQDSSGQLVTLVDVKRQ